MARYAASVYVSSPCANTWVDDFHIVSAVVIAHVQSSLLSPPSKCT